MSKVKEIKVDIILSLFDIEINSQRRRKRHNNFLKQNKQTKLKQGYNNSIKQKQTDKINKYNFLSQRM